MEITEYDGIDLFPLCLEWEAECNGDKFKMSAVAKELESDLHNISQ